ncbi:MAG: hypothetical protein F6J93_20155 [Oscillatoria sp. SIO1A7]|nr:hypothetical protein [Oscillatoria sp. SIO1A7]
MVVSIRGCGVWGVGCWVWGVGCWVLVKFPQLLSLTMLEALIALRLGLFGTFARLPYPLVVKTKKKPDRQHPLM